MNDFSLLENILVASSFTQKETYSSEQIGSKVSHLNYDDTLTFDDSLNFDVGIVGVNDFRGAKQVSEVEVADKVREAFFSLFAWDEKISIADFGNIKQGHSVEDTLEAIAEIQTFAMQKKIPLIIIGGSQDLTKGQYLSFKKNKHICHLCNVDAVVDFSNDVGDEKNFLQDIFLSEPNFLKGYFHVGLQSFLQKLEVIHKLYSLHFEIFRIGKMRENFSYIEPCFRMSELISIDMDVICNAYSPASQLSANGFTAQEFCLLGQYSGMSKAAKSLGIFNYLPSKDNNGMSAKLIAQFLWFFIEGRKKIKYEGELKNTDKYVEYTTFVDNYKTLFYQSKVTKRWWMKIEDCKPLPCAYMDYEKALRNEITERWSSYFSLQ